MRMKYCATVAALHTPDRKAEMQLVALMEKFTSAHGLRLAGGQPAGTNEYQDKTTVLDLSFGLGGLGSAVTLFYAGSTGDAVKADLDSYMARQVNPVFKVRNAATSPGSSPLGLPMRRNRMAT